MGLYVFNGADLLCAKEGLDLVFYDKLECKDVVAQCDCTCGSRTGIGFGLVRDWRKRNEFCCCER